MKHHRFKRLLSLLLVAALLAGFYVPAAQAATTGLSWKETDRELRPDMTDRIADTQAEERYHPSDLVRVSIVLEGKSTIQAGYGTRNIARNAGAMAYGSSLKAKQNALASAISTQVLDGKKLDVVWNLTLAANLISANVPYGKISAIEAVEGVKAVILENSYAPCVVEREDMAQPQMYASLGMTGSSLVWSTGFTGAGSRIAVIDTGTDTNHQSLNNGAFLYALQQNAEAAGMDFEDYLASLDLLDAQEIAAILPYLNINSRISGLTGSKLYLNEKLPFAANYVDCNLVVDHESDYQGEHGSHVAGIATANRYIPQGGGYADALGTVFVAGMAPDAQLITMKVFGNAEGPFDSDYMAAVEDAIYLGCDSVNLSLGSSMAGEAFNPYFADLLEYMTQTDTVVVASAGNSFAWPETTTFGYLYSDDVNMDTVGSPGSLGSFFAVASVENDGGIYRAFKVAGNTIPFIDSGDEGYCYPLATLDTSYDRSGTEYEYIFIDGLGKPEDYTGMDLEGKVVFCSRGELNFTEKANNAVDLGAVATVVYNNVPGVFGMDLTGYYYYAPCVSISQDDANKIRAASTRQSTAGGLTYYTGTMTILDMTIGTNNNSQYYTMSDFSSWGVPGDLSLKPEITAPGGNIYSLAGESYYGGGPDQYELMSGTSMAAPAITGMAALVSQYLRESGLAEQEGLKIRTLVQSLLMSTAVPLLEEDSGSYYSLLKQGAGLARADLAVTADSYILVDGQADGKVKAELGDDPNRTGVYKFSFSINNLSGQEVSYALSADVFRQDVFEAMQGGGVFLMDKWTTELPAVATFSVNGREIIAESDLSRYDLNGDGTTNAADADYLLEYLLGNEQTIHGTADVNGDGNVTTYDAHVLLALLKDNSGLVTVPADGSVTVQVTLTLPESSKALLDANYANGTYVEAFVYAESVTGDEGVTGTCHSIPVLAFYGNWSDPNMFDYSTTVEQMHPNDSTIPYMHNIIGTSGNTLTIDYGDGGEYYYGGNPYLWDDAYLPQRNAFNSEDASYLYNQYFTLIRNASDMQMVISNAETGEVYYKSEIGSHYSAFYHVNGGSWYNVQQGAYLGWSGTDASGRPLPEGTLVDVSLIAVPEYYRNEDGSHNYADLGRGAALSTQFTIDNTAPEVTDMELVDSTLTVEGLDNRHVAAVILMNAAGTSTIAAETPNQTQLNVPISLELDLENVMGKSFLLGIYDYAGNMTTYEITLDLPEPERPYFTVADRNSDAYYGLNKSGSSLMLAASDRGTIHAAEFVDGYVFEVSNGNQLYVAPNDDLGSFRYLATLDSENRYGITTFCDLAYSYADDTLYGLFYCRANSEYTPMLCTIDMFSGTMTVLGELPVDVSNMAIDGEGNFYSVGFYSTSLYTYTMEDLYEGTMHYVGEVGYYSTQYVNSLAWDHNTDKLYWAYPEVLLEIDPQTAVPTLLSYFDYLMVGLYITPETYGDRFAPTSNVRSVTLDRTENQTLVGHTVTLNALVCPWNVTDASVTWTSSNTNVATVDENGTVTGISAGTATITATSNLDPSKSAQCTFTVVELSKTLNAVICDEYGDTWWSEFNVSSLPTYSKLSNATDSFIASAAMMPDGTLYAVSAEFTSGNYRSSVYTVDPETFALSYVGMSSDGYVDIAPAPHINGGSLAAVYGGYVLFVDTETGEYFIYTSMSMNNLVGIAYAGSTYYNEYGFNSYVDWYFLIDTEGNVYYMGWLEDVDGQIYYLEHPETTNSIYTIIDAVSDTYYYSSAYYDGEYLYYSCYREQEGLNTLYAIETTGNRQAYKLGDFGHNVWPAGGLLELDSDFAFNQADAAPTAAPKAVEVQEELPALAVTTDRKMKEPVPGGGLNSIVPQSSGEYEEETENIIVRLTGVETAPNGLMTVTYDPSAMAFSGITGLTEAFAYTVENGKITVAFASTAELPQDTAVATLVFEPLKSGSHTITVNHQEAWNEPCGKEESLTVEIAHEHTYEDQVTAPTCTEQGYTTYTCTVCGHSYVDDYVDALDHDMGEWITTKEPTCTEKGTKQRECSRCDHTETEEIPATDHDYNAVVTEPTCEEGGYTTYTCTSCGHSYTDDYTDPVDHVYEDGHCKWCGKEAEEEETGLLGDVDGNGKVNHNDARLVLQYYVGIGTADSLDLTVADVDGNGRINHNDARLILQFYVGIITGFPVEDRIG